MTSMPPTPKCRKRRSIARARAKNYPIFSDERGVWVTLAAILMVSIFIISTAIYFTTEVPRQEHQKERQQAQRIKEDFKRLQGRLSALSTGEATTVGVPPGSTLSLTSSGSSAVGVIGYDTRSEFARGWADENISYDNGGLMLDNFIGNRFTMRSWFKPHQDISHELDDTTKKISLRFVAQRTGTINSVSVFGNVYQYTTYGEGVDNYYFWLENDSGGMPNGENISPYISTGLQGIPRTENKQWVKVSGMGASVEQGKTYHILIQLKNHFASFNDFSPSASAPFNTSWENHLRNENRGIVTHARNTDAPSWVFERREPTYVVEYSGGEQDGNPYHTDFYTDYDDEYGYGEFKGFWQYDYGKVSLDRSYDYGVMWGENFTIDSEVTVRAVDMFVGRGEDTPSGVLRVVLENADGVIENGLLARAADVGEDPSWIRYNFSQPRTLTDGPGSTKRYWVYLASDAGYYNYYSVPLDNAENAWADVRDTADPNIYADLTYGGTDSQLISSDDSGATWDNYASCDIAFALVLESSYSDPEVTGTYISEVIDAGKRSRWLSVQWDATEYPAVGAQVESVWVRTGQIKPTVNLNWPDEPDLQWSQWVAVSNGGTISSDKVARYMQFKIKLVTGSTQYTPLVRSVTVRYTSGTAVTLPDSTLKWVQTTAGDFNQGVGLSGTENVAASGGSVRLAAEFGGSWDTLTQPPIGPADKGGCRIAAMNGKVYFWVAYGGVDGGAGASDVRFYSYDPDTDIWSSLADAPISSAYGIGTGHAIDSGGENAIYITKGYWSGDRMWFDRYTDSGGWDATALDIIAEAEWSAGASQTYPRNGSKLVWGRDGYIYFFPGSGYDYTQYDWYRYSISGNSWSALSDLPFVNGPGNAATYVEGSVIGESEDFLFVYLGVAGTFKGDDYTNAEFWRYGLTSGTWTDLTEHCYGSDDGAAMQWDAGDYLYHTPGAWDESLPAEDERHVMRYSISSDSWEEMEPLPYTPEGGMDDGGGIVLIGENLYVMKGGDGNGSIASTDFWTYGVPTYYSLGAYVSPEFDAGGNVTFTKVEFDNINPSGTTLNIYLSFSSDGSSWSDWELVENGQTLDSSYQYVRYKVEFDASGNPGSSPIFSEIRITYTTSSVSTDSWEQTDWSEGATTPTVESSKFTTSYKKYYDNENVSSSVSVGDLVLEPGAGSTYWGDNFQVNTTLASDTLNETAERLSLRFRARRDENVYGVRVYVNSYSNADLAAEIYRDDGSGDPKAGDNITVENTGDITGTGWLYIAFSTPAVLVKDNIYHIVLRSVAATETENWWTQTTWVGGPQGTLQVDTWLDTYDNFYENTEVDWSQAGKIRAENESVTTPPTGIADYVVISEVFYDETGTDTNTFVEIYNPTSGAVTLTGWYIEAWDADDVDTTPHATYNFQAGASIPSHGYYLIGQAATLTSTDFDAAYNNVTPDHQSTFPSTIYNDAELLALYNDSSVYVDGLGYGTATNPNMPQTDLPSYSDVSAGSSIERKSGSTHSETEGNAYDTDDTLANCRTRSSGSVQPQNSSSATEDPPSGTIATQYENSWFTSSAFYATDDDARWNYVDWAETKPTGTDLTVYVRFENTPDPTGWTTGQPSDGGGTPAWQQVTNQQLLDNHARYAQYAAKLTADDNTYTAELENIRLRYGLPLAGASGTWTQDNWAGGDGQAMWDDNTKFDNSDSIDWENSPGSLELVEANIGTENYGNPFRVDSTTTTIQSESLDNLIDIRFTAQASKTVDAIRVYIDDYSGSPTLKVRLESNSGGYRSGTLVSPGAEGTASVTGAGWIQVALTTPPTLTADTVYHLVVWDPDVDLGIEVTEVMYDPNVTEAGTEWVEFYNHTGGSIDISTWSFWTNDEDQTLSQRAGWGSITNIPNDTFFVICEPDSTSTFETYWSLTANTSQYVAEASSALDLLNTGAQIVLSTGAAKTGTIYQDFVYPDLNNNDDHSTEKTDFDADETLAASWTDQATPSILEAGGTTLPGAAQSVTVNNITDGTNTITTYDGTGYLQDVNATVNMTLGTTPTAAPVLWFDVGADPISGAPSRSVTATGADTSWSAVIPASDSEVVDGALVRFLVNVDGTDYYLTGTTPWKYTVDEAAPTNVRCSTPASNATGVDNGTALVALTAADGGSGLHSTPYYFQLATDTNFTTGVQTSDWIANGDTTGWTPPLAEGTTYYWRVKAKDALGNESAQCGHTADTAGYGTFTTAAYTYVTSETAHEGGTTNFNNATGDNAEYENIYESDYGGGGGAVPVVEGFQATSGGGTAAASITLTAPAGITSGELLLIIVGSDDASNTQQFVDDVTGWSLIGESGDSVIDAHIAAYYRVATGGEGDVIVNAESSDDMFGWYIRISGADTTSPINVSNFTVAAGNATDHVVPQVTTGVANCLAIYGLSFDGGDGDPFSVSGTGWSESDEQEAGTGAANASGCWGTKQQATAGGTGTATVGCSVSDGAAYFQLAIAPAGSGAAYRENVQHNIASIPSAESYALQVKYYTAGDSESHTIYIYNFTSSGWDNAGNLEVGTGPFTFENTIDSDHISGNEVRAQFRQPDDDSTETALMVDYTRVKSWGAAAASATATGPLGSDNTTSQTLTYNYSGSPTSVKLYYTTNGGTNWNLAGTDASVDGSYAYTITSGDGTYGWIAVAIGGGSAETDPPTGGTAPEAGTFILDTAVPTVSETSPANSASDVPVDNNVVVVFSETMDTGTEPTLSQTLGTDPGGWTFSGWSTTTSTNDTATWTHNNWSNGDSITMKVELYRDNALNVGAASTWSFDVATGATATATGPLGSDNTTSQTLTYNYSGSPTSVKLYYTTNGGTNWNLAGTDASVDGSYAYTITSGDGTYGWIAVAIGGGSAETDPPTGGTAPENGTFILDTALPTVSETSPANGATDVPADNNVVVVFSETMDTGTEPTLSQTLGTDPGGWTFSGWSTTTSTNDTATWTHSAWTGGDSVTMKVELYRDNALNVGAASTWSFDVATGATATATGPLGSDNTTSQTLTYNYSGSPTSVKLYYTTNGGTNWYLVGEDTTVNGSHDNAINDGDGTYEWIAVAIGGGSAETDPPTGGTAPEAGTFILDTAVPTVSETSPANSASDVPVDNNVVVVFSETMDTGTEPTLSQTLGTDPGGWTFSGWSTTTSTNDTATWTHSAWTGGDSVTMKVELYRDNALNVGAASTWSFDVVTPAAWIKLLATQPQENMVPYDNAPDTNANVLTSTNGGTSWTVENLQPVFILDYSDSTYEGNPYVSADSWKINQDNFAGENLLVAGSDRVMNGVAVYIKKAGSPPNLRFTIKNDNGTTLVDNEQFVAAASVGTSYSWVENTNVSFTLRKDNRYVFYLSTPGGDYATNYYELNAPSASSSGASYETTTYNGASSFACKSTNAGTSWTSENNRDVVFVFTENKDTYQSSGYLQSSWREPQPGQSVDWGTITFNRTLPSGTDENVYVQISNDNTVEWSASGGPYTSGDSVGLSGRYARYRVYLGTSGANTPLFNDISIAWSTAGAGGSVTLRTSTPRNENTSYDNYLDNANVLYSADGTSWAARDNQPIYVLDVDTNGNGTVDAHEGNPYDSALAYAIYGDYYAGARFTISGAVSGKSKVTRGVYVYVRKVSSPTNALNYALYNISEGRELASGQAATAAQVGTSWTWINIPIKSALAEGKNYRLYLSTSEAGPTDRYEWMAPGRNVVFSVTEYATYDGTNTYGTTSATAGAGWTDNTRRDVIFRFEVADGIVSSGWLESSVYDAGETVDWTSMSASSSTSTGTSVTLKARAGSSSDPYGGDVPTVNSVYVSSEPDPLADSTDRVGGVTGGTYSSTQSLDSNYEQIAEGNVGSASYAYVSSETVTEGGTDGYSGKADADDGTYENIFENNYGGAGGSTTYDYSSGAGTDKWAYEGLGGNDVPPADNTPGTEVGDYTTISTSNDVRLANTTAGGPTSNPFHRFQFLVSEDPATITQLDYSWEGCGSTDVTPNNSLYIWNASTLAWDLLGSNAAVDPTDGTISGSITTGITNYFGGNTINLCVAGITNAQDYVYTDYVSITVTVGGAAAYRENVQQNITGISAAASYTLQAEYYTEGDSEAVTAYVYNFTTTNWDSAGTLQSATPTVFTYTIDSDHISGAPGEVRVRYVQAADDSTQTSLMVDYTRVASQPTEYQLNWEHNISGVTTGRDNYTLKIYGRRGSDQGVSAYIRNFTTSSWENLGELSTSDGWLTKFIAGGSISNYLSGGAMSVRYYQDASDTTQTTIYIDQVVLEENYMSAGGGDWSGWTTDISTLNDTRYIQYKLELSTSDPSTTPVVHSVTINYQDVSGVVNPPAITPTLQTWVQTTRADFLGGRAPGDLHTNIETVVPGDVSLKAADYWGNEFPQSSTYSSSLRLNHPQKKISFRFNAQRTSEIYEVHLAAWNAADGDSESLDADNISWYLRIENDDGAGKPNGIAEAENDNFIVNRTWNASIGEFLHYLSTGVVLNQNASLVQGNTYHIVIQPSAAITLVQPSSTNWVNFNLSKPKQPDNKWINNVTTNQNRAVMFFDNSGGGGYWQEITDREPTYILKYTDNTYEGNQYRKSTEVLFWMYEYTNYQGQKVKATSDMSAAAVEFYVKPRVGDSGMVMVGLKGFREENIESIIDLSTMEYSWIRATFDAPRNLWENDTYTITIASPESDPSNYMELVVNKNVMPSSYYASEYVDLTFGGEASCYVFGPSWTPKSTYDIPFRFVTKYRENGIFESKVFDAGQMVDWQYIEWDATVPMGTQLRFRARVGNDPDLSGDWSDWITVSGSSLSGLTNSRYIQYRAELTTDNNNRSPALHEVRITYRGGLGSLREVTRTSYYPAEEHIHEGGAVIIAQDDKSVMYSQPENFITVEDMAGDDLKVVVNYHMLRSVAGTRSTMATMGTFDIFVPEGPKYTVENEHTDNVEVIILSDYAEAWEGYLNDVARKLRNTYPSYQNIAKVSSNLSEGWVMLTINGKYTDSTSDIYYDEIATEYEVS